jgi:tetratricopeptide (TPR) repeat protein
MTRIKRITAALAAAGFISAAAGIVLATTPGEETAGSVVPALVGLDDGYACLVPAGNRMQVFNQLARAPKAQAAAKTEVAPFSRAVAHGPAALGADRPPLFDGLGPTAWRITTGSELAQRYFDQGLIMAYGFNHDEARRAFRAAQQLDPDCALCDWGEAYVLGPNLNAPMEPSAVAPAHAAIRRALAKSGGASAKERALIEATAKRYAATPEADRRALDAAYADAMTALARQYPNDHHVAVLAADAVMNLSPWDYWEAAGTRNKGRAGEARGLLERVLQADPDHVGAIHFYIHFVEASSSPERAEPYADRLAKLAVGIGHLRHMPSHIYYRIGRYKDSLAANRAAVATDERYLAQTDAAGAYPLAYYPHNVHFLLVSAQMAGDGKTVIEAAGKLNEVVTEEGLRNVPWVQPIKVAPYFAHAQFSDPATILALPDPGDEFPYVKAMWHYARGVAFVGQDRFDAARAERDAIARLAAAGRFDNLAAAGIPAKEVLAIAVRVIDARAAEARGDLKEAIAQFEQAVAIEGGFSYMEPPFWYYPLRQSLGAALLMDGQLDRAEAEFRQSLAKTPNNGWALYGLKAVYERRGDVKSVAALERKLGQAWVGSRAQLDLARL